MCFGELKFSFKLDSNCIEIKLFTMPLESLYYPFVFQLWLTPFSLFSVVPPFHLSSFLDIEEESTLFSFLVLYI